MPKYVPEVKNSLFRSSSTFGLHLGSGWSVACIILIAELDICEADGILYSHFFMREYVSLSELVSNGGLPISSVYLRKGMSSQYCTDAHQIEMLALNLDFKIQNAFFAHLLV